MNYITRIVKISRGQPTELRMRLLKIAQLVEQQPGPQEPDAPTTPDPNAKKEPQQPGPQDPSDYEVKLGDSLSGIAEDKFGKAEVWPQIYSLNKETIGNDPNLIEPGMRLKMPKTLRPLTPQEKTVMQKQTQQMHQTFMPPSKDPKVVAEEAKKKGLVRVDDAVPTKPGTVQAQSVYIDPRIKALLMELTHGVKDEHGLIDAKFGYVTEAWPPTVRHISQGHYTGHALDFVMGPNTSLENIRRIVKYMQGKGFRVANEYEQTYSTTTGKHLHVGVNPTSNNNLVGSTKGKAKHSRSD